MMTRQQTRIERLRAQIDELRARSAGSSSDAGAHHHILAGLAAVIQRIENGTYGICIECGAPIGHMHLMSSPSAILCVECADDEAWRPFLPLIS